MLANEESIIPQTKMLLQNEKWSYSRLSTFERCQRQFFHKYVEKRPTPASAPMIIGKITHQALEWIVKEGYQPEDAIRFAIFEQNGLPEGESFMSIVRMIENVLYRLPSENVLIQSEVHLELKTTLGTVQGYLDLIIDNPVNDTFELWDVKSGWAEQDAEDSMQLALYAWMISELRGAALSESIIGRFIFPRINSESLVIIDQVKIESAKKWFIKLVNEIRSKTEELVDWNLAVDKKVCETCPFVSMCASGLLENGCSASGDIADENEAKTLGEYILLQEQLLKNLKKGLKKYVENNMPVPVGDHHWHITISKPSPKVIDVNELVSYALENGLDFTEALVSDSAKLKEWLDEDETGILPQIVTWSSPRKSLKFGSLENE